jgi:hypothetical protein
MFLKNYALYVIIPIKLLVNFCIKPPYASQDRSVDTAMGYRLDDWGSTLGRDKIFFSSPQHPDWLWGPPSLLFNNAY